jgi:hypothetical protein
MRTPPNSTLILRLVFAVLFGLASVVPVPLRALGHSDAVQHAHAIAAPAAASAAGHHEDDATGHHHGSQHHHGSHLAAVPPAGDPPIAPDPANGAVSCHAAPCCLAVTQPAPSAPATILLLVGRLTVPPARVIVAVTPDPAVPPPRLQA